jgi:(1->4)-alpha-D-glucan 1-alpha-D-glucosylmutase
MVEPRATYRLQLTKGFTFRDARAVVPLLARLGVSHAYLSPILTARPGSTHGYDITDHTEINPELGGEIGFRELAETLHRHGLGILLDIVPNHMGIGPGNARWMDLLRWGRASASADFFDVDWQPPQAELVGKVLLPFLGGPPEAALAAGELQLAYGGAHLHVRYHDHVWPLTPTSVAPILEEAAARAPELAPLARDFRSLNALAGSTEALRLRAERLDQELAAQQQAHPVIEAVAAGWSHGDPSRLAQLLAQQCWHLADWHRAAREVNYRRFFAINDLIAIRVEQPAVFEASHAQILRLVADGLVDGLRIDHIDGLADPKAYLERLAAAVRSGGRRPYILVEKILGAGEALPAAWPVAGTTGYDRLGPIDRLFCDPAGAASLVRDYARHTGRPESPAPMVLAAKSRFLEEEFGSEMARLARAARRVADPAINTLPPEAFQQALSRIITHLPVYRTYADASGMDPVERARLVAAIDAAAIEPAALATFLTELLTGDLARRRDGAAAAAVLRLFQQLSGPAMAKGLEDTVFFQHVPLLALNEVGGEPGAQGLAPASFHELNQEKFRSRPTELIAGSTHDTKRGEDARARLLCLSAIAPLWQRKLATWQALLPALAPNDLVYLAQTLVGAWPPGLAPTDRAGLAAFAERIEPALLKAVREAKERTSWGAPDAAYEAGLKTAIGVALDPVRSAAFLEDLAAFCETVGFWGALTSLSATLLRLTTPGIPDIYQGSDGWNLSLVDPDNRRPVDFHAVAARLAVERRRLSDLRSNWHDGAVKSLLIRRTLAVRQKHPGLFTTAAYGPLAVEDGRFIAFTREQDQRLLVVAPRFWPSLWPTDAPLPLWDDARIAAPAGRYRNLITGRRVDVTGEPTGLATLLDEFPVGLLMTETAGA